MEAGRMERTMMGLGCSIADSQETPEMVYEPRYDCYFRSGSIEARPDRQFPDPFGSTPNHFSFLVRNMDREPLATVRISVLRPDLGMDRTARRQSLRRPSGFSGNCEPVLCRGQPPVLRRKPAATF